MASTASSRTERRYTPTLHYIGWMLRRYSWVMLLAGAIYVLFALVIRSRSYGDSEVFRLISSDGILPLRWSVVLFGLLTAFLLFGYLWNRREINCYGAIGLSRTKQFVIRYLLGLLFNLLPIVLTLTVAYLRNMQKISADPYGVCSHYTLVFILALCLISWLSYTVCTLVAILCGRFLLAIVCAGGVLAAPYAVVSAVQMLMNAFLLGAPGGALISGEFMSLENPIGLNLLRTYGQNTGLFTMLSDSLEDFFIRGDFLTNEESAKLYLENRPLPVVRFLLLAGLALVLLVIARWLFCRRKAEHAGQLYLHPVLSHATALVCGLGAAALLLRIPLPVERDAALWLKGILFVVALTVVTLFVHLILCREWRELLRGLPVTGGVAVLSLVTVICFVTGGFGYATAIPETDEIASVRVTYNQNHMVYYNIGGSSSSGSQWMGKFVIEDVNLHSYSFHQYSAFDVHWEDLPVLTDPADIAVARRVHQAIIDDGLRPYTARAAENYADSAVPVNYCISYTLKSGEVINRYYENLSLRALEATMELDDTDTLRGMMQTMHDNPRIPVSGLILSDPLFASTRLLRLTEEEKATLLSLLDADYADLSAEKRYFPAAGEVLGTIYLGNFAGGTGMEGGFTEDPIAENKWAEPLSRDSEIFYITADYTRTLAFLEERDLTQYMTASYTVKAVLVQPCTPRLVENRERGITYLFRSYPNLNILDGMRVDDVTRLPVSDWEDAIADSVPTAMLTRPGRLIFIVLENEEGREMGVTRFVPDP